MVNVLRIAGVFFLSIALIIFLLLLPLTLTLNSFLHPAIYLEAFEASGVYDYVGQGLNSTAGGSFIAIPEEGPKPLIEGLLSNLLSYIRSDTESLNLTVKIDTQSLRDFFLNATEDVPECVANQDPFDMENPCIPPGIDRQDFLDQFLARNELNFFASETVDLTTVYGLEENSEGRQALDTMRGYVSYFQSTPLILSLIIIFLIGFIYILDRNNIKSFLRTSALNLLIPALFIFVGVYFASKVPSYLPVPDPMILRAASAAIDVLNKKLVLYAAIMVMASIGLLAASFMVKEKKVDKKPEKKKV